MCKLPFIMLSLAFAVSAQAAFKEVDWIKSPGNIRLNTGYIPKCTDTFEMKVEFSTVPENGNQTLWCSRAGVNERTMTAILTGKTVRFDRNGNAGAPHLTHMQTNTLYTIVADYKTRKAHVGDAGNSVDMATGDFVPCAFVFLFASYGACDYTTTLANYGTYKLYRFTVKDELGREVRDYVPVKDDDTGTFGLFEKVTRHFYSGIGGSFTGAEPADGAATYELRASTGDVMADAVCWLRGGSDLDGDGKIGSVTTNELNDMAVGKRGVSLMGDPEGTRFRTERVHYNYLNVARDESCLWLPQLVTTNVVEDGGTVKTNLTCNPNKIIVPGVFAHGTGNLIGDYSVFVRFRPDTAILNLKDMHNWIVRIGLDWGNHRGLLFGLTGKDPNARHLIIFAGQQQWQLEGMTCPVGPDSWYEVLLSVTNGHSFAVTLCQTNGTLATHSWTIPEGNTAAFARSSALELGTESNSGSNLTYTISGSQPSDPNPWKAFRGSINQAAVWNRALTTDEARAVFAYPRAAVMRLGIENGLSSEFENTAPAGASVCADACLWTNAAPTLASGGSYDIHFTLSEADATCPQILRLVTLPSPLSGSGSVRVAVNGHVVKSRARLEPDAEQHVFVAADCFVPGENVLTLTRSDAGAEVVAFDALELTGSWRIGVGDGSEQFSQEGSALPDFYVTDGTWKHMPYAVSPNDKEEDSIRIHFTLPKGFADRYDYRYDFAAAAGGTDMRFKITVNDTEIYRTPSDRIQSQNIRIPRRVLKDGEDNVIAIRALEGVPSGTWESFCRHRLSVWNHEGFLMFFR